MNGPEGRRHLSLSILAKSSLTLVTDIGTEATTDTTCELSTSQVKGSQMVIPPAGT